MGPAICGGCGFEEKSIARGGLGWLGIHDLQSVDGELDRMKGFRKSTRLFVGCGSFVSHSELIYDAENSRAACRDCLYDDSGLRSKDSRCLRAQFGTESGSVAHA